jgi:DNA-binding GntR family transcriptional regulator
MPTSAERAYKYIRAEIFSGRYPPGSRLTEDTIASELAMSRTPVRDAIRRLCSEGLIRFTPNSGARIASWSETELVEITQMRALLESFAAELAAGKITAAECDELNRLNGEMERALEHEREPDLDRISAANLAFHHTIVAAAGNSRLLVTLEGLWAQPVLIRKFALFDRERLERSCNHHREIIAALTTRNGQWAAAIMRTHILSAQAYDSMLASSEKQQSDVERGGRANGAEIDGESRLPRRGA